MINCENFLIGEEGKDRLAVQIKNMTDILEVVHNFVSYDSYVTRLLSKNLKIKIYRTIILPVVCMGVKLGR